MKKSGVLNHRLSGIIASMGHTDSLVIADAGFPVPLRVERIDLAVSPGVPTFVQVLEAVAQELEVERVVIASELQDSGPAIIEAIEFAFPGAAVRAVVRTGECTPYANVLLYSGVIF
jgi:D-ribose pyranase